MEASAAAKAMNEPGGSTLSRVCSFVLRQRPAQIPEAVIARARYLLLDTLGITIASTPMEAGPIARDTAVLLHASADPSTAARLLFDGRPVSIAGAAYAAATQTDNLDGHDGYSPTKGHIGVAVVPALAAFAESLPDLTGPEALAALVIGYEVAGRAGIALHATVSDYHTSGAWNALGVVAIGARLRRLNDDQLRQAMGIAEYHGPRSQMMREIASPTMLHDGSGWGALAGVQAVMLAERGFQGAPAVTIEDAAVVPHWADLGSFWQSEHQYIKPYPVCRWAHAAVDATRQLCIDHALTPDDILSVSVSSFHYAAALFPGLPATTSEAQYSLPFNVATMIVYGRIGVEHITDAGLRDPDVARMLERITVSEGERHSARFPAGRWADVTITTRDRRVLASGDIHARGGPEAPFSDADIVAKYMEMAAPVLGEARAGAIRDAILSLSSEQSRFHDLVALIHEPPATTR